jgi:hypothetical protein
MSDTIRSIGAQMATMMYNLSQGANLPAETRDLMRDMHQRWDAAVSADKAPPPQSLLVGSEAVANSIVEAIFDDLRDRRFLKWLFDKQGDKVLIGVFRDGETLTGLDLEVQDDIKEAWRGIIVAALSAEVEG